MESFGLRRIWDQWSFGGIRFPIGQELRRGLITMTSVLGAFGTALVLQRVGQQDLTFVILTVVLALSLSRLPRHPGFHHRLLDFAAVPLVALGAGTVGQLLFQHPNFGAVAFVAAMTLSMWLRQFGRQVARVAQIITLPITSILVVPGIGIGGGHHSRWWQIVAALVALSWVLVVQAVARRAALLPPHPKARPATSQATCQPGLVWSLNGHTRMALQLVVALTAAFIIGRTAFPQHWNWVVLTATIVCSSGPGRGHVLFKGVARLIGAATGTIVATVLSANLPGHNDGTVVIIFVLLFLGSWGRELHYALWAGCVTCVSALLNNYVGLPGVSVLGTRLLAILVGAAIATLVCFFVVPTPTAIMVRRQRAFALQGLTGVTLGLAQGAEDVRERHHAFIGTIRDLHRSVRPLQFQRVALGRYLPPDPVLLSSIEGVLGCVQPTHQAVADCDGQLLDGSLRKSAGVVTRNIGLVRKQLAGTLSDDSGSLAPNVDERLMPLNSAVLAIVSAYPVGACPPTVDFPTTHGGR